VKFLKKNENANFLPALGGKLNVISHLKYNKLNERAGCAIGILKKLSKISLPNFQQTRHAALKVVQRFGIH